jgi:RND family efflux transporter MFP subunit
MPFARLALICGCIVIAGAVACHRATPAERESEPPIPVVTEPVRLGDIHAVVSATGVVEALPGADFAALAPELGRIVEIPKKVGDKVKAGDVLVRFEFPSSRAEDSVRAANAKRADVRLQTAKLAQARVQKLLSLGAASQQEMDSADREVHDAEVEVATYDEAQNAAAALGKLTTIRAPFDGIVSERLHEPGDLVGAATNDVIVRVIDPRQVQVAASVPVADAGRFPDGASARGVAVTRSVAEPLRVSSRTPPEPGATTVSVKLAFLEPTELAPGVELGIEIDAEQHSNVPLVPAVAVVKDGTQASVFVVAGDIARKRHVEIGVEDSQRMEIRSGVKPGESIVVQGQSNLRDGSVITASANPISPITITK